MFRVLGFKGLGAIDRECNLFLGAAVVQQCFYSMPKGSRHFTPQILCIVFLVCFLFALLFVLVFYLRHCSTRAAQPFHRARRGGWAGPRGNRRRLPTGLSIRYGTLDPSYTPPERQIARPGLRQTCLQARPTWEEKPDKTVTGAPGR